MLNETKKNLRKLLHKKPKNIIELGSGFFSIPFLRRETEKYGGFLTTLEDNNEWFEKITSKYSETSNHKIVFAEIIFDGSILRYDFRLEGIYDLVLIDGPGKISESNHDCLFQAIKPKYKYLLRKGSKRMGQSIMLLNYVWKHINHHSHIVIDGRPESALYYDKAFGKKTKVIRNKKRSTVIKKTRY